MFPKVIGPSYKIVRADIEKNLSKIFVINNDIKYIINKIIPKSSSLIKYGNWYTYKKYGISNKFEKQIIKDIVLLKLILNISK